MTLDEFKTLSPGQYIFSETLQAGDPAKIGESKTVSAAKYIFSETLFAEAPEDVKKHLSRWTIPYRKKEHEQVVWADTIAEQTQDALLKKIGVPSGDTLVSAGFRDHVHTIYWPLANKVIQLSPNEGWAAIYPA